jgi:hypothetical protein
LLEDRISNAFWYSDAVRMTRSALPLLLALGATLIFTDCATIAPPQPPSLNLPKPPQDLRATRKGKRVTLTWTVPIMTTDRQTIRSVGATQICRSPADQLKECGTPVGQVAPVELATAEAPGKKVTTSYSDILPPAIENASPSGQLTYAVEVLNHANRGAGLSNQVRVLLAPTLAGPQDFAARITKDGVVLSWARIPSPRGDPATLHFLVRVSRRDEANQRRITVGEVPIEGDPSLTDSNIEWEKTYEYHAEIVTVVREESGSEAQVEGDDTPELKVVAKDVFPPSVPSGLQAVFSGPGQTPFIDLIWAPVTDSDLAGYNVYRDEEGAEPVKLNSDPLTTPAYRDTHVSAGKRYFYSVTSTDVRGNESAKSEQASESVP